MGDFDACISKLESALRLIGESEHEVQSLIASIGDQDMPPELEEVFDYATHEIGSTLGFAIGDLKVLVARWKCRQRYRVLNSAEFEKVINTEWSVSLAKQIHASLGSREQLTLKEVSDILKDLIVEWDKLGKVVGKYT